MADNDPLFIHNISSSSDDSDDDDSTDTNANDGVVPDSVGVLTDLLHRLQNELGLDSPSCQHLSGIISTIETHILSHVQDFNWQHFNDANWTTRITNTIHYAMANRRNHVYESDTLKNHIARIGSFVWDNYYRSGGAPSRMQRHYKRHFRAAFAIDPYDSDEDDNLERRNEIHAIRRQVVNEWLALRTYLQHPNRPDIYGEFQEYLRSQPQTEPNQLRIVPELTDELRTALTIRVTGRFTDEMNVIANPNYH